MSNPQPERDLSVDEEGEAACMQVLENDKTPLDLRLRIHEGLYWLSAQHSFMGLASHPMILFHLSSMARLDPSARPLHLKAAEWSLDPHTANYAQAKQYLEAAYNGSASYKPINRNDEYLLHRDYARTLNVLGYHQDAIEFYVKLLERYPLDFGVAYLLRDTLSVLAAHGEVVAAKYDKYLEKTRELAGQMMKHGKNKYNGFVPLKDSDGSQWQPRRFDRLLSAENFEGFVRRREPFIISFGSIEELDKKLNWTSGRWLRDDYLKSKINRKQRVQILRQFERIPLQSNDPIHSIPRSLGYDATNYRKVIKFHQFLDNDKQSFDELLHRQSMEQNEALDVVYSYLNVQIEGLRDDMNQYYQNQIKQDKNKKKKKKLQAPIYVSPPIHHLIDDIPLPSMLDKVKGNMTQINLWMNANPYIISKEMSSEGYQRVKQYEMMSRLHVDGTDNLYVLLQGEKSFTIIDPSQAMHMETLLPTYAVAENGLSFRYNPFIYPIQEEGTPPQYNNLDVISGHFSNIQDIRKREDINSTRIYLRPGDILYLPAGWYHQVSSKGDHHKALNYWWNIPNLEELMESEKFVAAEVNTAIKKEKKEQRASSKQSSNTSPGVMYEEL